MITQTHTIGGQTCTIVTPQTDADLAGFAAFLRSAQRVAVDTETTGLNIYSPGHGVRIVQFGTREVAWNIRVDRFAWVIRDALKLDREWIMQNANYDIQVLAHHGLADAEMLWARVTDTRILAHLLDPRTRSEGGIGHGLKALAEVYVDPAAPDTSAGLAKVFASMGQTLASGWAAIDIEEPTYTLYAGLDVIYTRRLHDELAGLINGIERLAELAKFEHRLAALISQVETTGIRLDVPYTQNLRAQLFKDAQSYSATARYFGVSNVNSTAQVAEALTAMGETLDERTPSGAVKVDRAVLLSLADLDRDWKPLGTRLPNPLAAAVVQAKRAGKYAVTYADGFLEVADDAGRIHPSINTLGARTARMSVSRPALQQLPAGDWQIRRAILAEPGEVFVSVDFSSVEVRVLAALCGDPTLRAAIAAGGDLHAQTARAIFGEGYTKRHRQLAKGVVFGRCYGGGAATISRQTGAPLADVTDAIRAFDTTFPGVAKWASALQRRAEFGAREVVTPAGRHLPLDKDRLYAATNYVVQSTARDLMAQAVVDLADRGLIGALRMVIHDEALLSAPVKEAQEMAREVQAVMTSTFNGVPIEADAEIATGSSWGHLYGAPADNLQETA